MIFFEKYFDSISVRIKENRLRKLYSMRPKLPDFASYLPLQISQGSPEIMCSSIRFRRPEKIHDKNTKPRRKGEISKKTRESVSSEKRKKTRNNRSLETNRL